MKKRKKIVVKAREKKAIDYSNEVFWFFYSMLRVFFTFKQPKNSQNKF
jgi:hypothetical protein